MNKISITRKKDPSTWNSNTEDVKAQVSLVWGQPEVENELVCYKQRLRNNNVQDNGAISSINQCHTSWGHERDEKDVRER